LGLRTVDLENIASERQHGHNIAEHAVVGEADDPLRNTRTTLTNWLERAFVAPYFVNYHLEHHLFYYVPCYNLPKLHRVLRSGPYGARMEIAPGYAAVLRKATARPDDEDRPGELVHGLRRQANANANSAKAGF
jgi:fatty acid desaturase